jgi:hypothetical protein
MRSAAERKWFTSAQGQSEAASPFSNAEIAHLSGFSHQRRSRDPSNCRLQRNHTLQFGQIDKNRPNRIHRVQTIARYGPDRREKERPDASSARPISTRMVW